MKKAGTIRQVKMSSGKKYIRYISWSSLIILLLFSSSSLADDHDPSTNGRARIAVTDDVINVDGVLDEAAWQDALVIDLRYETSPGENVAPPVKTEALLIHNDDYLYVAFKAYDPDPSAIRAHLSDRDELMGDDSVAIILDTFNDELRAFEFECNPLGIQRDALRNDAGNGHGSDESWDVIWDSAGQVTEWGFAVEMAIPFNSLNFPRTSGEQTWGIIATRDYPRNVRHNIRNVPEDRSRNCSICQEAKVSGFENISPGRNIEFTPTLTGYRYDEREDFPDGERLNLASESELGLTARWGITPNINLNLALNPDFSQVEADSYQLEINRQFALRFEEKRPFFLEGRDFFGTPINAVYTRSIVDPGIGIKMTGKEGANALGLFIARDKVTPLIFPGSQDSNSATLDLETNASVFRYRRDILESSTIGLLLTDREGNGYFNRVYGFDGSIRLTSTDTVSFQVLGSSTQYNKTLFEKLMSEDDEEDDDESDNEDEKSLILPADTINDWAHQFRYEHRTRDWDASITHQRLGTDFRADIGYISRVGYQRFTLDGGRTWYGDSSDLITRLSIYTTYRQLDELNGGLLERELESGFRIRGAMQSSLSYEFRVSQQNYEDLATDIFFHSIRSSLRPAGNLDFDFNVSFGDAIDYRYAREGYKISLRPETSLNIGTHFRIDFEHEYTDFTVQNERLYLANVSQARFIYQFNSRMFLRSILQYIDIRRNQAMYADEIDLVSKRLFTQILFSYKLNPRTVLFLGYSDNYRAYQDIEFTQADRTFFMKIGYAWVL